MACDQGEPARAAPFFAESLTLAARGGDPWALADTLAGCAYLAVARGQPAQAGRLLGAAEACYEAHGIRAPSPDRPNYERVAAAVRAALGDAAPAAGPPAGRCRRPKPWPRRGPWRRPGGIAATDPESAPGPRLGRRERDVCGCWPEGGRPRDRRGAVYRAPDGAETHVADWLRQARGQLPPAAAARRRRPRPPRLRGCQGRPSRRLTEAYARAPGRFPESTSAICPMRTPRLRRNHWGRGGRGGGPSRSARSGAMLYALLSREGDAEAVARRQEFVAGLEGARVVRASTEPQPRPDQSGRGCAAPLPAAVAPAAAPGQAVRRPDGLGRRPQRASWQADGRGSRGRWSAARTISWLTPDSAAKHVEVSYA